MTERPPPVDPEGDEPADESDLGFDRDPGGPLELPPDDEG